MTSYADMLDQVQQPSDLRQLHARLLDEAAESVSLRSDNLGRASRISRLHAVWADAAQQVTAAQDRLRDTARHIASLLLASPDLLDADVVDGWMANLRMCLDEAPSWEAMYG